MKKRNKNLGSLKNKVFFPGGCVSGLSFKAFFKPYFAAYILFLIFSLLLTFNLKERKTNIIKIIKNKNKNVGSISVKRGYK